MVELRCGDTTAEVELIEDLTSDGAHEFWALPDDLAADAARRADMSRHTVQSAKQKRHPAIGYSHVSVRDRPTYEGSAAQARVCVCACASSDSESLEAALRSSSLGSMTLGKTCVVYDQVDKLLNYLLVKSASPY